MSSDFKCKRPGCPFHHMNKSDGSDGYCCRACLSDEGHHTRNCSFWKHTEICPKAEKNQPRGRKRSLQEETTNHIVKHAESSSSNLPAGIYISLPGSTPKIGERPPIRSRPYQKKTILWLCWFSRRHNSCHSTTAKVR